VRKRQRLLGERQEAVEGWMKQQLWRNWREETLETNRASAGKRGGGLSNPAVLTPVPLSYTRSVLDSSPAVARDLPRHEPRPFARHQFLLGLGPTRLAACL
jgi:hypothetical protein